jgi:hypothetical protein
MARVIAPCAVTGEASGTAAALAAKDTGGSLRELDARALQERLREQGVILDRRN